MDLRGRQESVACGDALAAVVPGEFVVATGRPYAAFAGWLFGLCSGFQAFLMPCDQFGQLPSRICSRTSRYCVASSGERQRLRVTRRRGIVDTSLELRRQLLHGMALSRNF